MSNHRERYNFVEGGCPATASEEINITVPVEVRAHSNVGNIELGCMGPAVVTRNSDITPGVPGAISRFTISQRLRLDVPLVFGAEAEVGEGHIEFASSAGSDQCNR